MTAPDLPAELKSALDARLHGLSRNDAAERSAVISKTYRDGGGSGAIRTEADALAYALARMPATYAAVTASLNALREITPGMPGVMMSGYSRADIRMGESDAHTGFLQKPFGIDMLLDATAAAFAAGTTDDG